MATYITLINFTDQGIRAVKETVQRYEASQKLAGQFGVTFKSIHWTLGQYDIVCELEAKDEASMASPRPGRREHGQSPHADPARLQC